MVEPEQRSLPREEGRGAVFAVMALALLLMMIDGADIAVMPLSVPYVSGQFKVAPSAFGLVLSAMPMGLGVGALLVGPLGDPYGRRPLIIGGLAVIAAATTGAAAAHSLNAFLVLRVLTGAALGACLVNINPLVAELVPPGLRARALTFNSSGIPIGSAISGFASPWVAARYGWQGMFVMLGSFVLVVTLASWAWLPESPGLVERVGAGGRQVAAGPAARPISLIAPVRSPYTFITCVFISLYLLNALSLYMLSAWLPTVLPTAGFSIPQAARMSSVMQLGGLAGGLAISTFVDRSATMPALLTSYLLVFVSLLAFRGLPPTIAGWSTLLLIVGGGITGAHLSIMAIGTLLYPPKVTAAALGLATAVARLGAVAGPLYGQLIIERHGATSDFFLALCAPVLLCGILVCLLPAVQRRRDAIGTA